MPKYVPAYIVQGRRNVWGRKDCSPPYFCNYSNQKGGADITHKIFDKVKKNYTCSLQFFWQSGGPVYAFLFEFHDVLLHSGDPPKTIPRKTEMNFFDIPTALCVYAFL